MEIVLVVLAFIFLIVGIIGSVFPIIPGPPLSFVGLLLLQKSGYLGFTTAFMIMWAGIALIVTVMDYILPSIMTKKFGGSIFASIGSILGLIVGLFFSPWGIIFGPFLGAFFGELIHSKADGARAFKAALGAFLAFLMGTGAKMTTSSFMLFFAIRAVFN